MPPPPRATPPHPCHRRERRCSVLIIPGSHPFARVKRMRTECGSFTSFTSFTWRDAIESRNPLILLGFRAFLRSAKLPEFWVQTARILGSNCPNFGFNFLSISGSNFDIISNYPPPVSPFLIAFNAAVSTSLLLQLIEIFLNVLFERELCLWC